MADFDFKINFDWKNAAQSTRAFFDQVEAGIRKINSSRASAATKTQRFTQLENQIGQALGPGFAGTPGQQSTAAILKARTAAAINAPDQKVTQQLLREDRLEAAKRGAADQRAQATDEELREARAAEAIETRRRTARERQATNQRIIDSKRGDTASQASKDEARARISAQQVAAVQASQRQRVINDEVGRDKFIQGQAEKANLEATEAAQLKAVAAKRALGLTDEQIKIEQDLVKAEADALVSTKLKAIEVRKQATALIRQRAAQGDAQALAALSGTSFQRLQANVATRTSGVPRLPSEFQTGPQFFQSKLLTTAGFAASGAIFFGLTQGIQTTYDEAKKLQEQFALIQSQLEQLGKGDDFDTIKSGVLSVARETGIASDQIASLAFQLQGAFGPEIQRNGIQFLVQQLRSAGEIARVTGLPLDEVTDSLTALAKTFGITFQQIGDTSVGLQQRFGVLSREIITFTADLAPTAKQAGLSFQELAAIGATLQQTSGRSGGALAEQTGRVLPEIQAQATAIIQLFQTAGRTGKGVQEIQKLLGSGQTGQAFIKIIQEAAKLPKADQNRLVNILGGARQAGVITSLLQGIKGFNKEINRINSGQNDAGKLEEQFQRFRNTIGQTFAELREAAVQLGIALIDAGIGDVLVDIGRAAKTLLGIIRPLVSLFGNLAGLLKGVGGGTNLFGKVLEAAVLVKGISLARGGGGANVGPNGQRGGPIGFARGILQALTFGAFGGPARPNEAGFLSQRLAGAGVAGVDQLPAKGRVVGQRIASRLETGVRGFAAGLFGPLQNFKAGTGFTGFLKAGFGSPVGMAATITAGFIVLDQFQKNVQEVQKKQKQFVEKAKAVAAKDPGRLSRDFQATNFADQFFDNPFAAIGTAVLGGGDTPEKLARDADQEIVGKGIRAGLKRLRGKGLFLNRQTVNGLGQGSETQQSIQQVLNETTNLTDDDVARQLEEARDLLIKLNPEFAKAFQKGLEQAKAKAKAKPVLNAGKITIADAQDAQQLFQLGVIDVNQFSADIASKRKDLESAIQSVQADPTARKEAMGQLVQLINIENETLSTLVTTHVNTLLDLRHATGQPEGLADIPLLNQALQDPRLKSEDQRAAILKQSLAAYGAELNKRINATKDAAQKTLIAQQGIEVDPVTRVEAVRQQIRQITVSGGLRDQRLKKAAEDGDITEITQRVAENIVNLGLNTRDALILAVNQEIKDARAARKVLQGQVKKARGKKRKELLKQIDALSAQIDAAKGLRDDLKQGDFNLNEQPEDPKVVTAEVNPEDQKNAAKEIALARADFMKALVENDPLAAAQADLDAANIQAQFAEGEAEQLQAAAAQIRAQHAVENAIKDIAQARLDLLKAFVGNDPVKVAQVSLQQAQLSVDQADGEAAKLRALAQQVEAQRALEAAIFEVSQSQLSLLQAFADAAGDTVSSAAIALQSLQAKLAEARRTGAGAAELNNIQADIVRQQAALRDADLAERESLIDFNLQTKKISTAQAIAQYQALLSQADILHLTEQQRRDLILKIQSLKQGLSQDLQFNLPSELRLPTLYEVRRLNQSGGQYQDNRTVNIALTADSSNEFDNAVSTIVDAINQPPVYGTRPRIY